MGGQMWMLHKMWAIRVTMPSQVGHDEDLCVCTLAALRTKPELPVNI